MGVVEPQRQQCYDFLRMKWDRRQSKQRNRPAAPAPIRPVGPSHLATTHQIDPFALFCAYHLGITEDNGYRFQNIHQVAKRFGTNAGVIRQLLMEYEMDSDAVVHSAFDMAGAQVDIMLAPEGIDRTELARDLFVQFRASPRRARDWQKELEQDARDNERIFGPRNEKTGVRDQGLGVGHCPLGPLHRYPIPGPRPPLLPVAIARLRR